MRIGEEGLAGADEIQREDKDIKIKVEKGADLTGVHMDNDGLRPKIDHVDDNRGSFFLVLRVLIIILMRTWPRKARCNSSVRADDQIRKKRGG